MKNRRAEVNRVLAIALAIALNWLLISASRVLAAGEVRYFELESQSDFLEGTLEGIAIDPLGALSLADRTERVADLGEPFLLSAAVHPKGWVVGTGNDGKVLLVDRDGSVITLYEAAEPEVFAVAVASDGTVFAGTSPQGKVYRIENGSGSEVFDPEQTYIWDLLPMADGSLLVATGTEGKLFRVLDPSAAASAGAGSSTAELVFDSEDTHLRTLESLRSGDVLIGTAGDGLILRMKPDGSVRTIFDAAQPEVVAFAEGSGDTSYAAVLASEASQVDLSARPGAPLAGTRAGSGDRTRDSSEGDEDGQATVTVSAGPAKAIAAIGTRTADFQGPRSEILRIRGDTVDTVWSFDADTVYSLSWQRNRLWVGTGLEGKIFSLYEGRMVLEKDLDERQVVAVLADAAGPVYATTNAAALFRSVGEPERVGTFISPVLDAGQTSDFGSLSWVGTLLEGTDIRFSARTGMSGRADRTWSDWSADASGSEVPLAGVPPGRFIQWRARLVSGNGTSPELSRIAISYRQRNLPPRIQKFEVMAPGQVIVPPGFIPGSQTFEPSRPDRSGMFSVLASPKKERDRQRKTLWKKGYRTLSWTAEDPNGDDLRYALYFRRDRSDMDWLPMADELEEEFFSFDATALPDGVYRFKLEAHDRHENELEPPLLAEEISEPAYVDHSPPRLVATRVISGRLEIDLADDMNPLEEAAYSVDAREWLPAKVKDGLLDGKKETLEIELPPQRTAQILLLRVRDAAFNVITFDLSMELP
ncbi:MAG: hypothetical protein IH936_10815 [Acidobacteria bacterium]|nr:hypothetical protein [Acidobacteriota bacterium]